MRGKGQCAKCGKGDEVGMHEVRGGTHRFPGPYLHIPIPHISLASHTTLSFHTTRYQQLSPDGSSSGYSGQTASGGQRSPSVSGGAGGGGDGGGGGGGGGGGDMAESSYERRSGGSAMVAGGGLAGGSFSSTPTSGLHDPAVTALMANPVWCECGGRGASQALGWAVDGRGP